MDKTKIQSKNKSKGMLARLIAPAALTVVAVAFSGMSMAADDSTTIVPETKPLPVFEPPVPSGTLCGASTTNALFAGGPSHCIMNGVAHDPKVSCPTGWNKRSITSARSDMPGNQVVITYSCVKA